MAILNLSLAAKQARANAISTIIGASGTIKLYNGTQPATPDTALSGNTLLSTMTGNATAFAASAVTNGVNNLTGGLGGTGMTPTNGTFAVAFAGGGGSGAAALAVVSSGAITGYIITNPGTGYTSAPTVSLAAGGGTPPTAPTAVLGVVLAANAITQDSSAAASGTPTFARISTSDGTAHIDVDVGAVGSNASFQITPATVTAGASVSCSSFAIEEA